MKLGTNYPHGPFEWAPAMIGVKNIFALLDVLSQTDKRYSPSSLLKQEATDSWVFILNIDTSMQTASVSFAENGTVLASASNHSQKDHAGFLHTPFNHSLENGISLKKLDAVAVTGPGSYTGLRGWYGQC